MSSVFGKNIVCSLFGESHGPAIGVTIDGLPAGEEIDPEELVSFLERRAPGRNPWSSPRKESDLPEVISGLREGKTTGAPLTALIFNEDAHSHEDHCHCGEEHEACEHGHCACEEKDMIPRPGHADLTAHIRYRGFNDPVSGGHLSGRLTAPLCVAGGIALQILARRGIHIGAHIVRIANEVDRLFDPVKVNEKQFAALRKKDFPVLCKEAGTKMQAAIAAAHDAGDSVGGVIEVAAIGVPAGKGSPLFERVENKIAAIVFGIPAVRGLEFGDGFDGMALRGSQFNDPFCADGTCKSNHAGGMLGGITTGMPVIFRVAVKPTPSIRKPQASLNLRTYAPAVCQSTGRNDPCIVPRAVPVMEAAMALALLDVLEEG